MPRPTAPSPSDGMPESRAQSGPRATRTKGQQRCETSFSGADDVRVEPLLRVLIVEAAQLKGSDLDGYLGRITSLIIDQLRRAEADPCALPGPRSGVLMAVCESLYANSSDPRGLEELAGKLGLSGRALARRFKRQLGMNFRSWKRQLRLFKSIELLGGSLSVTEAAIELGYSSASGFIYAFRSEMGCSSQTYMPRQAAD